MCRVVPASALFLATLLAPIAAADGPSDSYKGKPTVAGDKLPPGVFAGKLMSLPSNSGRKFVLEVEYSYLVPKNPAATGRANNSIDHKLQKIAKLQTEIGRSKNPAAKVAQMEKLVAQVQVDAAKGQANLYRVVSEKKEIEFRASEDWTVRYLNPPPKFDDKGRPAKYTKAELKELKGPNPDQIGYESKEADLATGQTVRVTLRTPKETAADKKAVVKSARDDAEGKAKPDAKDKPDDKAAAKAKPEVTLIVILAEVPDKGSAPARTK